MELNNPLKEGKFFFSILDNSLFQLHNIDNIDNIDNSVEVEVIKLEEEPNY